MLRGLSSLFEDTRPRAQPDRLALALLVLIVAVGAAVRFWGLGNVGLHGDEKTMALPAMHLLAYGTPEMPSGFVYPRALAQLYLMAGSVLAFGPSEWAFRLPSAICGVLLIALTWLAGRRFLEPRWNLALTAAVALLPAFIEDAQTARMYVFLVTGVAGFMALLFAWERTGRSGYLIAAVIEMAVSLEFHTLSIFAAWLCFLPGALSGDRRRLGQGAVAFAAIVGAFVALNRWIASEYPHALGAIDGTPINGPRAMAPPLHLLWLFIAVVPALALSWYVIRGKGRLPAVLLPAVLLAVSLVAQVARLDHAAILLIIAALVLARRQGELSWRRLALFFGTCALLAAVQVAYLTGHHAGSLAQILGLMLGWPSVRAYLALARFSWAALLIAVGGVAVGLRRLAHRERVPDHLLFLALGVFIPLLQIGCFKWDPAPRYVEGQMLPLLIGVFALAQWAVGAARARQPRQSPPARSILTPVRFGAAAAAVVCLLVIDPAHLEAAVDPTYAEYPDHKGAAEFIESQHPTPHDIIVAEDALMQTYYLGHVNYWLQDREQAAPFLHELGGRWVDVYTDAPLIGSGAQLEQLVHSRHRGAIYVIGSGENASDRKTLMRGLGIEQVLESPAFHLVYVGRDRVTDVWKVDAPRQALTVAVGPARGR
ncbi:MAG TPA: glycosyltransferase family 39 protein [Steroidobacteraceae bacterium]|nr:glycosyltransferase family 39 protein [Steroidobacteraceae bacterium]